VRFPSTVVPHAQDDVTLKIAVVDGGNFELHKIKVDLSIRVPSMAKRIRKSLQLEGTLGDEFKSDLDILPLPTMPTLSELQGEDLAELHSKSCQDLPHEGLATYFNLVADPLQERIQFIVWLPAESGVCLFPVYIYYMTFMPPKSDFRLTFPPGS
jgi:phage shock protein PspC (stress-responsive transcriptional regulator)